MARHLSVASVIDKNKISSGNPWVTLLEIQITDPNTRMVVETLYLAQNNENVLFGPAGSEQVYQQANFQFNVTEQSNAAPSVTITAQDQTRFIQSRMEAMAGGVFSNVIMRVVNTARLAMAPEIEESFQITSATAKDYVVTFTLGAENPLTIQFPKHTQSKDRCAWRFRGYGCGYTGAATTCSYTKDDPNGCLAKGNVLNFRGLPGLVRMNL